jgi:hypothetical protein
MFLVLYPATDGGVAVNELRLLLSLLLIANLVNMGSPS